MKRVLLTLMLMLITATILIAGQSQEIQGLANKIADAIAVPLYSYDLNSVASVIEIIAKDDESIRAIDLVDANSEEVIFTGFKSTNDFFIVQKHFEGHYHIEGKD